MILTDVEYILILFFTLNLMILKWPIAQLNTILMIQMLNHALRDILNQAFKIS